MALLVFSSDSGALLIDLERSRAFVTKIVNSRHCHNCHSPKGVRPMESAMRIYDLSKFNWFAKMSDRQLKEFRRRIVMSLTPQELLEMGGKSDEKPLAPADEAEISKWLQAELRYRHPGSIEQLLAP